MLSTFDLQRIDFLPAKYRLQGTHLKKRPVDKAYFRRPSKVTLSLTEWAIFHPKQSRWETVVGRTPGRKSLTSMLRHGLRLALPEDFGLRARRYRRGDSWPRRPEASIPGGQRQARRIVHRGGAGTLRGVGGRGRRAECSRRIMRNDHIFSSLIE